MKNNIYFNSRQTLLNWETLFNYTLWESLGWKTESHVMFIYREHLSRVVTISYMKRIDVQIRSSHGQLSEINVSERSELFSWTKTHNLPDRELSLPDRELSLPGREFSLPDREFVLPDKELILPCLPAKTSKLLLHSKKRHIWMKIQ